MTGEDWINLAKCFTEEHERIWAKCHPHDPDGSRFALELQSYAMICYSMANKTLKGNKE